MADKAISELVAAEQIKSTDMFVLEQDGTAKRLQGQTLLNWLTAAADGHGGISNIAKTGTDGLVDTYTITLADTTTKTFTVTNGNGLTNFEKLSTVGLVDNYRFTRTDGTFFDFSVYNGAKGDKGEDSHVWIKYASQQPTADSHSMGDLPDAWMGVYSGTAAEAPDDWQQYTWYQIKGEKGNTGAAATVTGTTVEYMVSDSGTIVPSGSWSTVIPTVPQGKYLWTKVTTTFNTGSPAVSYSVTRMGIDGAGSVSSVNEKSPDESGNVSLSAEDISTSGGRSVQAVLDDKQEALTAGENISISGSVIATKAFPCNPKLLRNWYFGNPVNQRNGYVVPPGTNYKDVGDGTDVGATSTYVKVDSFSGNNALITIDGTQYFVQPGGYVRGYTGKGYGIDGWLTQTPWGESGETVTVEDGCIKLASVAVPEYPTSYGKWQQIIEAKAALVGKVVTAAIFVESVVSGDGPGVFLGIGDSATAVSGNEVQITAPGVYAVTNSWTEAMDRVYVRVSRGSTTPAEVSIKAISLELGSVQTLAHQENGVWVLNEIPDYGEQLRRCQRYFYRLNSHAYGWTYNNAVANCLIPLPVTLRTAPVITLNGSGTINTVTGDAAMTSYEIKSVESNGLIIDLHNAANALTAGTPVVWHNFQIDISADL